jgi:hypothetical protein
MGLVTFNGVVCVARDNGKSGEVENAPTDARVFRHFLGGDTTDVVSTSREGVSRLQRLPTE